MRLALPTLPAFAGVFKPALPLASPNFSNHVRFNSVDQFVPTQLRFGSCPHNTPEQARIALTTMAIEGGITAADIQERLQIPTIDILTPLSPVTDPGISYRAEGDYFEAESEGARANTPLGLLWLRAAKEPELGLAEVLTHYLDTRHAMTHYPSLMHRAMQQVFMGVESGPFALSVLGNITFSKGTVPPQYIDQNKKLVNRVIGSNDTIDYYMFSILGNNRNLHHDQGMRDCVTTLLSRPSAYTDMGNRKQGLADGLTANPYLTDSTELLAQVRQLACDRDTRVRAHVAHMLAQRAIDVSESSEIVPLLQQLAQDKSSVVRQHLVRGIAARRTLSQSPELIAIIRSLASDTVATVRELVAINLRLVTDRSESPDLRDIQHQLAHDPSARVRRRVPKD